MALLQQPLFNPRLIAKNVDVRPIPEAQAAIVHGWAEEIRSGRITQQKETAIRRPFLEKFFVQILGYRGYGQGESWQIHDEQGAGRGAVDCALGEFSHDGSRIVAPFELKGADTVSLDAIMPGRHKSPVQQAWEYANDTPGCHFVLVSNMVELRMYAVGHGRQAYERWHLADLVDPREYARLQLLLSAENLLSGRTAQLLESSVKADKEITDKLYCDYRTLRINLIVSLAQSNEHLSLAEAIEHAQTILDRVLFIAFAEDRRLLPEKTLEQAFAARNPFNPQPVWDNFKGLFAAIDKGSPALGIAAYNGGLFAHDPALSALRVGDDICHQFRQLGDYDFASEVGVTVLGHIFEQSVADLEELRHAADEGTFELKVKEQTKRASARSVKGRRKDEGVVYTPDHVTAFIVEQALGGYLQAQFERRLRAYVVDPERPHDTDGEIVWKPLARDDKAARERLPRTGGRAAGGKFQGDVEARAYEYLFWRDWMDFLKTVRVVDPACGSGAFLVAAFDWLQAEYTRVNEQLHAITGSYDLFDLNKAILNGNLYGVDLNAESVEITKLSLWLKTAERGKPLTSLEANIHLGNSLIRGSEYSQRAFDWQAAFPEAFAAGGFDVVLGNPPYVRMERIKPIKPYLKRHYQVAADRADLYAYFYEIAVRELLRAGGRLGYISSNSFMKTRSGEPLRRFLLARTRLLAMVDFGDLQIFEGVTTYPVVVIAEKRAADTAPAENEALRYLVLEEKPGSLSAAFEQQAQQMPLSQLGSGSWQLETPALAALRRKLIDGHPTLKQVYGSPLYGIKTGLNEAFVVDRATRDELIRRDPRSADLLKPFLVGDDLKKWHAEPPSSWLIYIPRNKISIDDFPAIREHLLPFRRRPERKSDLERRATQQAWFELQQGAVGESGVFDRNKLVFPEISQGPKFSIDRSRAYLNKTVFSLPTDDARLLGLLSSKLAWFFFLGEANALRGGSWRLLMQQVYLERFPVPPEGEYERIADLAACLQLLSEQHRDVCSEVARRIPDLAPGSRVDKLPGVLQDWWQHDFAGFRAAVKKHFKQDIPLAERSDWERYLETERAKVQGLDAEIARLEAQLDREVYALFVLDEAEITLLESTLSRAGQQEEEEAA